MGRRPKKEYVTMAEAAKILGMTKMGISRLIRRGALSAITIKRPYLIRRAEVEEYKKFREIKALRPFEAKTEIMNLEYRVNKIQRQLDTLMKYLGVNDIVVFTDAQLKKIYDEAVELVEKNQSIARITLEKWHLIFANINEEELRKIKILTGNPAPFVPFIRLCENIITQAKTSKSSKSYSQWIGIFMIHRKNLRDKAAVLMSDTPFYLSPYKRVDMAVSMGVLTDKGFQEALKDLPGVHPENLLKDNKE